jgi:hypothetical protein
MGKRVQKLIYKTKTDDDNEQVSSVDIILDADKVLRQNNYSKNVESSLNEVEENVFNLKSSLTTVQNSLLKVNSALEDPNSNNLINVYNEMAKYDDKIDNLSNQITDLSSKKFLDEYFDISTIEEE